MWFTVENETNAFFNPPAFHLHLKSSFIWICGETKPQLLTWCDFKVYCHTGSHLVVVPPLSLVFRTHLTNQLLHFGPSQWILCGHRVGVTGSVDLLGRIVVRDLVGAVSASPRRCFIIQAWWCSKVERRMYERQQVFFTMKSLFDIHHTGDANWYSNGNLFIERE